MIHGYPAILRELYERYFSGPDPSGKHASSHWRAQHTRLNVRYDQKAYTVAEASGFGLETNISPAQRLLSWLTVLAHLVVLPNRGRLIKLVLTALRISLRLSHPFTIDCFRHCCVFALLERHLKGKHILVIGDGIGFLSLLFRELRPDLRLTLVDLGKTLFIQALHAAKARPSDRARLLDGPAQDDADLTFCPAENLHHLSDQRFDLAINTNSMQEMHPEVVAEYFARLRHWLAPKGLFYCSNREEKALPSGEILRFLEYPWQEGDLHVVDETCLWSIFFLSRRRCARGPSLLGLRVPLIQYYDGRTLHRLTRLSAPRADAMAAHP